MDRLTIEGPDVQQTWLSGNSNPKIDRKVANLEI
jgi:hypothetical protein